MPTLLNTRPGKHPIIPRLQCWKFIDIDTSPESTSNPVQRISMGASPEIIWEQRAELLKHANLQYLDNF